MNKRLSVPFYENTLNAHPLPIWILKSEDNTFYSINAMSEKEFLYSEEDLLGKKITDICPSFSQSELYTLSLGKNDQKFLTKIRRKDGKELPAELQIATIYEDGEFYYYIIVTPLLILNAEHGNMTLTNSFFHHVFYKSIVPMIIAEKNTSKIIQVNDGAIRLYGYSHDEFVELYFKDLGYQHEEGNVARIFNSIQSGKYSKYDCKHITKQDKDIEVEMFIQPLNSVDGSLLYIIINDVTEKKLALKFLEESLTNYKMIASNSTDLIIRQNEEGKISYASPVSLKLLGYKPSYLVAENIFSFIHPDDQVRIRNGIINMVETAHYKTRFRIKNFQGRYVWFESTAKIIMGPEASGEREIISISRDISDRIEIEKKLREADKKSDEIEKLKHIILSNLSHELRTPLQSILGYSEIIKDKLVNADLLSDLNNIYDNGKRLLRMINLFLNLSYLESSNFLPHFESYNINEIIAGVADSFKNTAEEKNIFFNENLNDDPIYIKTDKILLRDILDNLIDNAIKFTEKGGVQINSFIKNRTEGGTAVIEIKDTGIGIPKDKEDLVFQEFRQLSEGLSRKYEGIGLGLAISKRIIERLNGILNVESIEGKGTIVSIKFPLG